MYKRLSAEKNANIKHRSCTKKNICTTVVMLCHFTKHIWHMSMEFLEFLVLGREFPQQFV